MYLTPLQDWRHTLTYKSRNDDPLDDGKEELYADCHILERAVKHSTRARTFFFFFSFVSAKLDWLGLACMAAESGAR